MAFYPESKTPVSALAVGAVALGLCAMVLVYAGPLLGAAAVVMGVWALVVIKKGVGKEGESRGPARRGKGLAGLGIVAGVAGMLISVAIYVAAPEWFSLEHPRELLNRMVDAKRAEVLLREALRKAKADDGQMPPHLAAVVLKWSPNNYHILLSKTSHATLLPPIRSDATWQEIAEQVDASSDYLYVGADVNLTGLTNEAGGGAGQVIVLYTKKDVYPDHGRLVGYADGHVDWVTAEELKRAFTNSNQQRTGMKLPAVEMDGPPPAPLARTAATTQTTTQITEAPKEILTVADAMEALKTRDLNRRQTAIRFLLKTPSEPESRRGVSILLGQCVAEPALRLESLTALKTWGTTENVLGLTNQLNTLKENDPLRPYILLALGGTGDVGQVAGRLIEELKKDATRPSAIEALVILGPDVETVMIPYLDDPKIGRAACEVLAKVGTARSVTALKTVNPKNNPGLKREAEDAIKTIETRIGATP
ncbi:MAG: DUF4190 domain-containing protein [Phycisphaerales bacterium]|nr:DUF4190 domain-containing protein [Phycisphaerales bacterium]